MGTQVKDNTLLLWAIPGPRNISENIEMTVTKSPSYLEVTEWLKCSDEEERYIPITGSLQVRGRRLTTY